MTKAASSKKPQKAVVASRSASNSAALKTTPKKVAPIPAVPDLDFKSGDMVVYPGHGVGKISAVHTKILAGSEQKIFEIVVGESGGMKIMVPIAQAKCVGLRKVADKKTVDKVYSILKDKRGAKIDTQTWNRRFREYSQKIKTGSVVEIAEVLRDLCVLSGGKELSFGEKRMRETAQNLLVSEIAIAKARTHDKIKTELQAIFQ